MATPFSLEGKVAVVTGGSRGIGRAIALAMAKAGADVVIAARKPQDLEATAKDIEATGRQCLAVPTNVRQKPELDNLIAQTTAEFGRLDILVNNAVTNPHFGPVDTAEEWQFDVIMNTNLKAYFMLSVAAMKEMLKVGGGSIINLSSSGGFRYMTGLGLYCISKAADIMLTKVQAVEWARYNIRVNAIAPSIVRTDFARALWDTPAIYNQAMSGTPMKRIAEPEELGDVAVFLASQASSYITGQVIVADGGAQAGPPPATW